jgi:hypothetical protein
MINMGLEGVGTDALLTQTASCPPTLGDIYGTLLSAGTDAERNQALRLFQ